MFPSSIEVEGKTYVPKVSIKRQYYRVRHDQTQWRENDPEVFRLDPDWHVVISCAAQWLWRNINPHLTLNQCIALYSNNLAFTNGTGFPGHHNCLTEEEIDKKLPRFDQMRVCGGAILSGFESGNKLIVDCIDVRKPLPPAEVVRSRPDWFFEAVNIDWIGDKAVIRPLKGLWGKPVYVPVWKMIDVVTYPLALLEKLPLGEPLPSPYRYP